MLGGGKSLTYFLPPLVQKGFMVVVQPLLSLTMDQMYTLNGFKVPCASYNSSLGLKQKQVLKQGSFIVGIDG